MVSTRPGASAPLVTVVVPTRNASRTLDACLRSLRLQTYEPIEIVVVDNHSEDDTREIGLAYADRVEVVGPERSAQRNAGAMLGCGEVLIFIDADMVLEPEVVVQAVEGLAHESVCGVVVPERSFGVGTWARAKALEKLIIEGDPAVEACRAVRRSDFESIGGYDERLVAFEDWDFSDRLLEAHGGRPARTTAFIWHDEGQLRLWATYRKKRYYGSAMALWRKSAPPHRLRRRTDGAMFRRLVRHPGLAMALVTMKSAELAGFAAGSRSARRAR